MATARPTGRRLFIHARRVDLTGRHWIIRFPARAARVTDLLIFATFADGNVFADLGLKEVQAR